MADKSDLEKFGKVEEFCQSVYNFEFKITEGFSGSLEDTLAVSKICREIAPEYPFVNKMNTDKGNFHLILTKLSKTK